MKKILITLCLTLFSIQSTPLYAAQLPEFDYDKKMTPSIQSYVNRKAQEAIDNDTQTMETINDFRREKQTRYLVGIQGKKQPVRWRFQQKTKQNIKNNINILVRVLLNCEELTLDSVQTFVQEEEARLLSIEKNMKEKCEKSRSQNRTNKKEKLQRMKENQPDQYQKMLQQQRDYYYEIKNSDQEKYKKILEKHNQSKKKRLRKMKKENPEKYEEFKQKRRNYSAKYRQKKAQEARFAVQSGNLDILSEVSSRILQKMQEPKTQKNLLVANILQTFAAQEPGTPAYMDSIRTLSYAEEGTAAYSAFESLYDDEADAVDSILIDLELDDSMPSAIETDGATSSSLNSGGATSSAIEVFEDIFIDLELDGDMIDDENSQGSDLFDFLSDSPLGKRPSPEFLFEGETLHSSKRFKDNSME